MHSGAVGFVLGVVAIQNRAIAALSTENGREHESRVVRIVNDK